MSDEKAKGRSSEEWVGKPERRIHVGFFLCLSITGTTTEENPCKDALIRIAEFGHYKL